MAKTVLLIEDEVNIIEALSFILSRDGWDVVTHSNGHDANEVITRREPDLVVLDVMLPGKSGLKYCAICGAIRGTKIAPYSC